MNDITAQPGDDAKSTQRRKLACEVCRRMKTRCDYDSVSGFCRRCTNLRIECSLSILDTHENASRSSFGPGAQQDGATITLEELRSSIDDLKIEVRNHLAGTWGRNDADQSRRNTLRGLPSPFDNTGSPADKPSQSAPISVVREVSDSLHWPTRREFVDKSADVVTSGVLLEHQAVQLASA
ncbi:hypothetical protein GQ53DRAFT_135590 [Thozetella sp. PMI_491]|nr:hypothetical protein GQ53DRAFT_135590 [Thozetella sp. PMI_491]